MPLETREGALESGELKSLEASPQNFADLPNDSGDLIYRAYLPDDSCQTATPKLSDIVPPNNDNKERKSFERMEQAIIKFKYPENVNAAQKKEFDRQLKAQERGINSQTVAENIKNRREYQLRKAETGNGRLPEAGIAQQRAREKAITQRIQSNQKKGMNFSEAKREADAWIQTQAALHNPDQIAGGNPLTVSRMGDKNINSSIGGQWSSRVVLLDSAVNQFVQEHPNQDLAQIKMNVKLEAE